MSQNLQIFVKFQKFQLENLVDFENAAKRIFSCKNRCRYSRKRATSCQKLTEEMTAPPVPPPASGRATIGRPGDVDRDAAAEGGGRRVREGEGRPRRGPRERSAKIKLKIKKPVLKIKSIRSSKLKI